MNIEILVRITRKDNTKRPRKIKVTSISKKYEILRKALGLRQTEEYHATYILPDLTNEQQMNGKLLRDEMKLRTNNGEANLWLQRGKVVVVWERWWWCEKEKVQCKNMYSTKSCTG